MTSQEVNNYNLRINIIALIIHRVHDLLLIMIIVHHKGYIINADARAVTVRFYYGRCVINTTDKTVRFFNAIQHLGRAIRRKSGPGRRKLPFSSWRFSILTPPPFSNYV